MSESNAAKLIIISGPSGAGKSTVTKRLLAECELPLRMSVSATTRKPRPGEIPGKAYHFVSQDEFDQLRSDNAFLECKEVFGRGHWYGTLRSEVTNGIRAGQWVILEIDVQGALEVMQHSDLDAISLFIHPGSMEELERRLRDRGTESEKAIQSRLETAADEMRFLHEYQYEIINGAVDAAVAQVCRILKDHQENQVCSKN
ncbi:guanylate kinase [Stieleria sp. JC731]|uniref:guanylate kinase n=1 Tax=Pirellulaceae TaxID=2691357 RepID=UPI001E6126F4|nr:guanylate kinase [Stieleria sp. JC731]MCC9600545.1 guanylate kinase [Stieleria sp. JC731]